MAIRSASKSSSHRGREQKETIHEVRLKIDKNKDGLIDREELEAAIRKAGGRMAWWKSVYAMVLADTNGDGFLDESELKKLAKHAEKHLGVKLFFDF